MVLAQPTDFLNKVGQVTAEGLSNTGALVGGVAGSLAGPWWGVAGAAGGDAIQTGLEDVFEDRTTQPERLRNLRRT